MVDMNYFLNNILDGLKHILTAPSRDLSILWLLAPLILIWLFLEIYFGRFKEERLGWNSALGNGLSMFWITIISFRVMFADKPQFFTIGKLIFVIIIGMYALFIVYVSFSHKVRAKVPFLIAAPTVVYYLSAVALLWVNNLIKMDRWIVLDLVILYILIVIFEAIFKKLIPAAVKEIESEFGIDLGSEKEPGLGIGGLGDVEQDIK